MSRVASRFLVVLMATLMATSWITIRPAPAFAVSPNIVISQLYGGGSNAGATYTHDYVELFNRGNAMQSLAGWSVQYASATGTGTFAQNSPVALSGSIPPGGYFLVRLAGGAVGSPLPTPDISATAPNMSGTSGKVIVANVATGLACNGGSTPCDSSQLAQIVDLVGYGATNFFEGSGPAPALSNTTSAFRGSSGCTDTDNNSSDFTAATPAARNSATPLSPCGGGITLSIDNVSHNESTGSQLYDFTVSLSGAPGPGGVTFDISTADNSATTADNDYVGQTLVAQTITAPNTTYVFSVTVNGDTAFEDDETFFVNVTNVTGATLVDGQGVGTLVNDDPDTCGDPATLIHDIQGSGTSAAQTGVRTIEGVVVGDYQGTGQFGGYFVQEEADDFDADVLTSEGIFVFNTSTPVGIGDLVRVRGTAGEFSGMTQLSTVTTTLTCSTGNPFFSSSVTLPVAALADWERYEGMHVTIGQELTVTEVFTLGRFGEVALSVGGRLENPTNEVDPGAAAIALQNLNDRSRILLDDGNNLQNIDPTFYPAGGLSASNTLRVGDSMTSLSGVLEFRFNVYRVQPVDTSSIVFNHTNARPASPTPVGGDLQVAAFNVLNYFNGNGTGLDGAAGGFPTARGATNLFEFNRQRDKIISAITQLDAAVVGLMELENDATAGAEVGAIEDLVAGLNTSAGADDWAFIDTGVVGTDAIRVGIIYQPAFVTPVGSHAIINSTVDPRFIDTLNRPSIAQSFASTSNGARFTVVVNHLKSKGSDCNHVGDPDTGDGQGNCNVTRTNAARALVDWIATDPTASGDPDVIVIGDMNAYAREDPIGVFQDAGYVDTIDQYLEGAGYSFVFQGQSGYLDHALASPSLAEQISGVTEWHVNADEPIVLDYNTEFKTANQINTFYADDAYRSSDHDPVLVGIDLAGVAPTIAVSSGLSCTTSGGTFAVAVDDSEEGPNGLVLTLEGNTNTTLIPNANVVFGGSGANRTVAISAASKKSGTAVLTIGVSDGESTTTVTISVQVGTDANDTLTGTAGADLLLGGQGTDNLSGLGGADVLCGGTGNDTASGGEGNDALEGDKGNDNLSGGDGSDVLRGGVGNDSLSGGNNDDTLTGNAGADAFSGGAGTDTNTDVTPSQGDTWDGT